MTIWHGCSILQQYWLNVSDLWREELRGDVRRRGDRWKVWQLPVSVWQQGGRLHSPGAKGEIISSSDSESRVKTSIPHWTDNNERFLQVAEPKFLFGTIRDWFGKHTDKLDTAASNLHFYVQEHHKHTGDKCIYKYRLILSDICRLEAGVHSQHWSSLLAPQPGELHHHREGAWVHWLDVRRSVSNCLYTY